MKSHSLVLIWYLEGEFNTLHTKTHHEGT